MDQCPQAFSEYPDEERISNFCCWCKELGVDMSRIQIKRTKDRGLGVFSMQDLGARDVVVSIPIHAVLTVAKAVRSDIGQAVLCSRTTQSARISTQALMYIVMIEGRAKLESKWHAWLNLIPQEYGDPLWWTPQERARLLAGTQLQHEVARHEAQLSEVYQSLFPALSEENPELFPAEQYTWDAFRWARSALASRCFEETALDTLIAGGHMTSEIANLIAKEKLGTQEESRLMHDCPAIVCPLLDMINHDPGATMHVGVVQCEDQTVCKVGLMITEPVVLAGAEVLGNYGNCRSNGQFLLGHGFCVHRNGSDTLPLRLGASPALSANPIRQHALRLSGLCIDEVHGISSEGTLPRRLIALLRVMLMATPVLKKLIHSAEADSEGHEAKAQETFLTALTKDRQPSLKDAKHELEVLGALRQHLLHKKRTIEDGMPTDRNDSHAECHALYYREGQLRAIAAGLRTVQDTEQLWQMKRLRAKRTSGSQGERHKESGNKESGQKQTDACETSEPQREQAQDAQCEACNVEAKEEAAEQNKVERLETGKDDTLNRQDAMSLHKPDGDQTDVNTSGRACAEGAQSVQKKARLQS